MKQNVYSVTQANSYLQNMISQDFLCSSIVVQGELSNVTYHHFSGHVYFTLKDSGAAISCVMYKSDKNGLSFRLEEGKSVVVSGYIDYFVRDGKVQLKAKKITPDGIGKLYEEYERIKKELEEMGLFAPEYKKPIPKYVKRVGVVTSRTGAVIDDIIKVATRRNPFIEIILSPATVQGDSAVESIIQGIRRLEKEDIDVIIVARGGGSMEDLWPFNSPVLAQAVFDCSIPIVTGVGHEPDVTIIDYVADLRAATPSMAAEVVVCNIQEVFDTIDSYHLQLSQKMQKKLDIIRLQMQKYELKLKNVSPVAMTKEKRAHMQRLEENLKAAMQNKVVTSKNRFALAIAKLSVLSPMQKLASGYGYVTCENGEPVKQAMQLKTGDELTVWMKDAKVVTTVKQVQENKYE